MSVAPVDLSLDKPLPQNPDAERSVLGSILLDNQVYYQVIGTIRAEDFYRDAHRLIFAAMSDLASESRPIDLLTVKEELGRKKLLDQSGGPAYISSLVDGIPDIGNVERYARIVKEKATLRRLILMGNQVIKAAFDAPQEPSEVLGIAERSIYEIAEQSLEAGFASLEQITKINLAAIEQLQHSQKLVTGVTTGYRAFNEMTSGFQKQDLIILAARPSMGKTSLMLNMAEAMATPERQGGGERAHPVGIFSLEMSKEQIGLRLLCSEAAVPLHLIRSGLISQKQESALVGASARLARAPIWVDDTAMLDIMDLRARARRLKMEHGLEVIMVDYLQLMHVRGRVESRTQEISQISRGLKAVAKELDLPLIALSQLSRRPEQRTGDHRPQLADLRESGSIEQDADVMSFIYRDEVYNKESEEKGVAEIIIGKQRNGPIGSFKLVFRHDITKFLEFAEEPEFLPE